MLCLHGLPKWLSGKESVCQVGDVGLIPRSGRSPGEGSGYPLQYSCLGNPMDRGAWQATVLGSQNVRHDLVTNRQQCVHIESTAKYYIRIKSHVTFSCPRVGHLEISPLG